jgi:uncharacterized membrane protein YgdD (TMEM256/DUF423 family)
MNRYFLIAGSLFAGLAVILGAFGAHALKSKLAAEQIQVFETGVKYQMYHAIALIVLFALSEKIGSSMLNYSGYFFTAGIILFSGSLYLLSCSELLGIEKMKSILGPITPLGGLSLIIGWVCLLISALKIK